MKTIWLLPLHIDTSHSVVDPQRESAWTLALILWNWSAAVIACHQSIWKDALRRGLGKFGLVPTSVVVCMWFLNQQHPITWEHVKIQTFGHVIGNMCFKKSSSWFWCTLKFENCWCVVSISLGMLILYLPSATFTRT